MSTEKLAPDFEIYVNGSKLPKAAAEAVISVSIDQATDMADFFQIRLNNDQFKWSDSPLFKEGGKVKIDLGYVGKLKTVFEGEITAIKCSFPRTGTSQIVVFGYDKYHRMRRVQKSRSFLKMKDSEIVQKIAGEYGLSAEVEDTYIKHDCVFQNEQSDIDFLLERGRQIGYIIKLKGDTLKFKKIKTKGKIALKWGKDLKQFRPVTSVTAQLSEVEVRAWDPVEKVEIIGKAASSDIDDRMGGATTGPDLVKKILGGSKAVIVDIPVRSKAEADTVARGKLNERARNFITGSGMCTGNEKIKPGATVELEGLGLIFSGKYYVTGTRHLMSHHGYTTSFDVRRTAYGVAYEPPKPPAGRDKPPPTFRKSEEQEKEPEPVVVNATWSKERATELQAVNMHVECYNVDPGETATFKIYSRDATGKTKFVEEKSGTVGENQAELGWSYEYQDGREIGVGGHSAGVSSADMPSPAAGA